MPGREVAVKVTTFSVKNSRPDHQISWLWYRTLWTGRRSVSSALFGQRRVKDRQPSSCNYTSQDPADRPLQSLYHHLQAKLWSVVRLSWHCPRLSSTTLDDFSAKSRQRQRQTNLMSQAEAFRKASGNFNRSHALSSCRHVFGMHTLRAIINSLFRDQDLSGP